MPTARRRARQLNVHDARLLINEQRPLIRGLVHCKVKLIGFQSYSNVATPVLLILRVVEMAIVESLSAVYGFRKHLVTPLWTHRLPYIHTSKYTNMWLTQRTPERHAYDERDLPAVTTQKS